MVLRKVISPAIKEKIYVALLLAVAITLPLPIVYNGISIFSLLFFSVLTGDILTIRSFHFTKAYYLLPCLFGFYLLGIIYSTEKDLGFQELEQKLSLLAFPFIFAAIPSLSLKNQRLILLIFSYSLVFLGFICFSNAIWLNYHDGFTLSRLVEAVFEHKYRDTLFPFFNYWYFTYDFLSKPIGIHPIYFSMYINLGIVIIYFYESRLPKIWKGFLIGFLFLILLLLSSRTQLFIGLLIFCYIIFLEVKRRNYFTVFGVISLVLSLSFLVFKFNPLASLRISEVFDFSKDYHQNQYGGRSLRLKKWDCALKVCKQNPILGTGTGADKKALLNVYLEENFLEGYKAQYNAHNQYLQTAVVLGLVGLFYLLFLLQSLFREGLKNQKPLLSLLILIFSISIITESMFSVQKGIVFFSFFICLTAFPSARSSKEPENLNLES